MKLKISGALAALIILAGATVALAQGGASTQKTARAAKPAASTGPFDKALLTPSALNAKAPDTFDVKFTTDAGDFVVHATREWAPNGVDHFYNLVKHHYYDGAAFFRVLSGFMAQFGISAYPEVNAALANSNIKDDPVRKSNTRGMVTFAQTVSPTAEALNCLLILPTIMVWMDSASRQ